MSRRLPSRGRSGEQRARRRRLGAAQQPPSDLDRFGTQTIPPLRHAPSLARQAPRMGLAARLLKIYAKSHRQR